MTVKYIIVETDFHTGELQIGFQSFGKVVIMADYLLLEGTEITNKFYNMDIIKTVIKKLEQHNKKIEKLI